MDFTGKIIAVLPVRSGESKSSGNKWIVQSFVIENHDQYPKKMCFEVFGEDRIQQFGIKEGEELTVSFDIDARQWQDRWFNTIRAWKIERANDSMDRPQPEKEVIQGNPTASPQDFLATDNKDDLPF